MCITAKGKDQEMSTLRSPRCRNYQVQTIENVWVFITECRWQRKESVNSNTHHKTHSGGKNTRRKEKGRLCNKEKGGRREILLCKASLQRSVERFQPLYGK